MGSTGEDDGTRLRNNAKVFQSGLNEIPNKMPMTTATGVAMRFKVSAVGMTIASWPNCRNGRRECPAGGVTKRKIINKTTVDTIATARKTMDCARSRYQ